ncbi:MAG: hypothetical protein KJO81_01455 [Gammaproteobacteria bacterium]|nr:hypothetical protein [Gammaproteobacteria bacterium]
MKKIFSVILFVIGIILTLSLLVQIIKFVMGLGVIFLSEDLSMGDGAFVFGQIIFYVGLAVLIFFIFKFAKKLWVAKSIK